MKSDDKPKKPTTRSSPAPTPRKAARTAKTGAAPTMDGDGLEAEIRRRAYEIYLSRGDDRGDQVADWLEAERMVRDAKPPRNAKT